MQDASNNPANKAAKQNLAQALVRLERVVMVPLVVDDSASSPSSWLSVMTGTGTLYPPLSCFALSERFGRVDALSPTLRRSPLPHRPQPSPLLSRLHPSMAFPSSSCERALWLRFAPKLCTPSRARYILTVSILTRAGFPILNRAVPPPCQYCSPPPLYCSPP